MKSIVFGRWGDILRDYRGTNRADPDTSARYLPQAEQFPEDLVALMCGKGMLLLDDDFDYFAMIRQYVDLIQEKYCCGKCLTGIKGTALMLRYMNRISEGEGAAEDLDMLERVAEILDSAARCSVCQSAGELVKDGLANFKADFLKAVESGVTERPVRYLGRISAPCINACPCHINVPGYVEALQEARYHESLEIIREEMPLPGVTGRICPAPCERACTLGNQGRAAIPIRELKRVAADYEMNHKLTPPLEKRELDALPVAVVGAGPAGLSAAYYLNRRGHAVTLLESLDVPGGMVGVGVPPYRQPRKVLERDIGIIADLGVEVKLGVKLGRDFTIQDLFNQGFKAVFLGIGSHRSIPLGIKGEDEGIGGVFPGGIDFLRDINLGEEVLLGDRVVVVGGGNTAIDCARTCLRMGASEVQIVYRRTEKEMPSDPHEVADAREEGILLNLLTQPVEIAAEDGKMVALKCIRMELGEPDASGRRRPVPVEDSEFEIDADSLVPAIGQKADLSFLSPDDGIDVTRRGNIKVDEHTMMTTRPGVFAAGDAVTGPLTVVHGVAGGKQAAKMMHDYVTTGQCGVSEEQKIENIIAEIEEDPGVFVTPKTESRTGSLVPPKKLDMRERVATFREVDSGFTQESSFVEASRCLRCYHLIFAAFRETEADRKVGTSRHHGLS